MNIERQSTGVNLQKFQVKSYARERKRERYRECNEEEFSLIKILKYINVWKTRSRYE